MSTKMSKARIDELVAINIAEDQEFTRAMRKQGSFFKTLKKVLKNHKELRPLWDQLDFMQIDPSCFQEDLLDVFMEAWKTSKRG